MDGEQFTRGLSPGVEYSPYLDGKPSVDCVWDALGMFCRPTIKQLGD